MRLKQRTSAIKKSMIGIGHNFSRSAGRVADIILDDNQEFKDLKAQKITEETLSMFKDVTKQLKTNLRDVQPRDFIRDAAYGVGKISSLTRRVLGAIFNCQE